MYNKIKNPITGKKFSITSENGMRILNNYLVQSGGKFIAKGAYKCVFNPPIKCLGDTTRYSGTSNQNNYVSAVMLKEDADEELSELNKILPIIDSDKEFTIQNVHMCKLGDLDSSEEPPEDFINCDNISHINRISEYPYEDYRGDGDKDLVQLIFPYGGKDLSVIKKTLNSESIQVMDLFINFISILEGVKKMKDKGYIHGDIKPPNILYNKQTKKYYLIDFGLSKKISEIFSDPWNEFYYSHTVGSTNGIGYPYWPPCSGISEDLLSKKNSMSHTQWKSSKDIFLKKINTMLNVTNITDIDEFIRQSSKKFDVYSLSFIISEFFNTDILLSKLKQQIPTINIANLSKDLDNLRKKMKNKNPIDRLSIENVIKEYNNLLNKYFINPFEYSQRMLPYDLGFNII